MKRRLQTGRRIPGKCAWMQMCRFHTAYPRFQSEWREVPNCRLHNSDCHGQCLFFQTACTLCKCQPMARVVLRPHSRLLTWVVLCSVANVVSVYFPTGEQHAPQSLMVGGRRRSAQLPAADKCTPRAEQFTLIQNDYSCIITICIMIPARGLWYAECPYLPALHWRLYTWTSTSSIWKTAMSLKCMQMLGW